MKEADPKAFQRHEFQADIISPDTKNVKHCMTTKSQSLPESASLHSQEVEPLEFNLISWLQQSKQGKWHIRSGLNDDSRPIPWCRKDPFLQDPCRPAESLEDLDYIFFAADV